MHTCLSENDGKKELSIIRNITNNTQILDQNVRKFSVFSMLFTSATYVRIPMPYTHALYPCNIYEFYKVKNRELSPMSFIL